MKLSSLAGYKRITIKVGSALLVDPASGKPRAQWLSSLAEDIAALKREGHEIIIVSSGAISLGRRILGMTAKSLPLDQNQAAASVGQIALSQAWRDALMAHDITTGQILITPNITEERRHYLNARTTISTLLALGRGADHQRERHASPQPRSAMATTTGSAPASPPCSGADLPHHPFRCRRPLHRPPGDRSECRAHRRTWKL